MSLLPEISVSPSQILHFQLAGASSNGDDYVTLTLANNATDGSALAFKVKTTKPKRYMVKPNQGFIRAGEEEKITITLVRGEKKVLYQEYVETGSSDDSNKFLVQSVTLGPETLREFHALPPKDLSTKLTSMWAAIGDDKSLQRHNKLKVRFSFSDATPPQDATATATGETGGERQGGGEEYQRKEKTKSKSTRSGSQSQARDGDTFYEEVKSLRSKYDDLVSFTVNLTAEKDLIQSALEATKEDLAKEKRLRDMQEKEGGRKAQGKSETLRAAGVAGGSMGAAEGFNLLQLLLAALVCFFAGQYMAK